MSQEYDRKIYIIVFNILCNVEGCDDQYRLLYQTTLKQIEANYDEDTIRRWIT